MIDGTLARRLRLIGFDVDGVLTDGGVYLGRVADHPVELKRFEIGRASCRERVYVLV